MGKAQACAIAPDGEVICWSVLASRGDAANRPQFEPELQGVKAVSVGGGHACAIAADNLWCWGGNAYGQLGNGTLVGSGYPSLVIPSWSNGIQLETDASGSDDDIGRRSRRWHRWRR